LLRFVVEFFYEVAMPIMILNALEIWFGLSNKKVEKLRGLMKEFFNEQIKIMWY
jgi:hypothetical protein